MQYKFFDFFNKVDFFRFFLYREVFIETLIVLNFWLGVYT